MKSLATCAFFLSQSKAIINDAIKRFDIRPFRPPLLLSIKTRAVTDSVATRANITPYISFIFYFGPSVVVEIGAVVMTPVDDLTRSEVFTIQYSCSWSGV